MRTMKIIYTGGCDEYLEGCLEKIMIDKAGWEYVSHKDNKDGSVEINFKKTWVLKKND